MSPTLRSLFILAATITPALAQTAAPAAPTAPPRPLTAPPAAQPAPAQTFKKLAARVDLKDGDTFVFLGDSITHQCLYTQYVEDYFYTRYPKTRLHFHNSGVGGDRAQDALDRFDTDVAAHKPKYVSILLGMNDGSYTKFEQPIFDQYQKGMTTVLNRIAEIGATAIPMTPTMYDSRANKKLNRPASELKELYYNGVLSFYGSWLREQALERGLGFVDMWSPLNNLTFERRRTTADFSMINDAVHPGQTGQVVMATALLADAVPRSVVSQIVVDRTILKTGFTAAKGKLANLQRPTPDTVTFEFTAEALPWVLPSDAHEGWTLTAAGHRHSNEKVTVRDLTPGKYDLRIDGKTIGSYTSGQLAMGVELENNDKTPQYQQGLKVAMLNAQRNNEAMRPLRDLYGQLKGRRRNLDKAKAENNPGLADLTKQFEEWKAEFPAKAKALQDKAADFEAQIYKINQPVLQKYEVSPTKS